MADNLATRQKLHKHAILSTVTNILNKTTVCLIINSKMTIIIQIIHLLIPNAPRGMKKAPTHMAIKIRILKNQNLERK